jgi:hypothetical protein
MAIDHSTVKGQWALTIQRAMGIGNGNGKGKGKDEGRRMTMNAFTRLGHLGILSWSTKFFSWSMTHRPSTMKIDPGGHGSWG